MAHKKTKLSSVFAEFVELTIIGASVFFLVYLTLGQKLEITGDSMYPTLENGEHIVAEKISTKLKPIARGNIVVFEHPQDPKRLLIKRVVGLPNENILLQNGNVYINNTLLESAEETFGKNIIQDGVEYKIPDDSYILMGDNRDNSVDSRSIGSIKRELIVGKALLVYYPLGNFRLVAH